MAPTKDPDVARRMMSERMFAIAPIVIAIVSGAFIAVLMPATWMSSAVFVVTGVVVLVLWLRGRNPSRR